MAYRFVQIIDRLDGEVERLRGIHGSDGPGFCIAFVANGQTLRQVTHGIANLEWQQPIAEDTRFYLASESKPWTAALVMSCVAAGKVGLDTDIRKRLPALSSYQQPIYLGHLLRHTSGIDDYLGLWHAQLGHHENDLITQDQALELIRRSHDVSFLPGTKYDYSNSNYVLLAELLQQLEGCSIAELASGQCFEPWGMQHTSFENQPWRVMPRRARSYERDVKLESSWRDVPVPLASWGDGGIWSTLADLSRAECQWQDDADGSATQFLLTRCCAEDLRFGPPGQPYRFGLEVVQHAGREFVFHGGGYASFSSLVLRCPTDRASLVVLSNVEGFEAAASSWLERLWGS